MNRVLLVIIAVLVLALVGSGILGWIMFDRWLERRHFNETLNQLTYYGTMNATLTGQQTEPDPDDPIPALIKQLESTGQVPVEPTIVHALLTVPAEVANHQQPLTLLVAWVERGELARHVIVLGPNGEIGRVGVNEGWVHDSGAVRQLTQYGAIAVEGSPTTDHSGWGNLFTIPEGVGPDQLRVRILYDNGKTETFPIAVQDLNRTVTPVEEVIEP